MVTIMDNFLSDELLEQLATLSKLELAASDKQELRSNLAQMLSYVDKLSELCTDDSLPLSHFPECSFPLDALLSGSSGPVHSIPGLREDTPCPQAHPESFTALAPKQKDGYYIVPNTF